jgi:hypothetical protein
MFVKRLRNEVHFRREGVPPGTGMRATTGDAS